MERTIENVEMIQSACNPVAVLGELHKMSLDVLHETRSMDAVKTDPYILAVLGKVMDLFQISCSYEDGNKLYAIFNKQ